MIHYVCKYSPIELFKGFGEKCSVLDHMPENFDLSDRVAHPNLCGFGKSVIQSVLAGSVEELVLVNCCDTIRRVYDIIGAASCTFWICRTRTGAARGKDSRGALRTLEANIRHFREKHLTVRLLPRPLPRLNRHWDRMLEFSECV